MVLNIPGLYLIENCITQNFEKQLLENIYKHDWDSKIKRRVQHYGHVFEYKYRKVNHNNYTEFPKWIEELKIKLLGLIPLHDFNPNQCTINEYIPGIGISPHIDTHSSFDNTIISLSLENPTIMNFIDKSTLVNSNKQELILPPRSLLIIKDNARYCYSHGISWRKTDNIDGLITKRGKRVSITLRELSKKPCECNWPNLCDSQNAILDKTRL